MKGRKIKTLKGKSTRPTSNKVKESLFNIIADFIDGAKVLDLFAGSGSIGIEALSRGAKHAWFVDSNYESIKIIKDNLLETGLSDKSTVIYSNVFKVFKKSEINNEKFDVAFLDPPYNKNILIKTLSFIDINDIISDKGVVIVERNKIDILPDYIGKLKVIREYKYGDTVLSLYKNMNILDRDFFANK